MCNISILNNNSAFKSFILGLIVKWSTGRRMKLEILISNRGNGVSSQNLIRNPSKLIGGLSGSRSHFFQPLASAGDGIDGVE